MTGSIRSTLGSALALAVFLAPLGCEGDETGLQVVSMDENPSPVLTDVTPDVAELDRQETTFTAAGRDFIAQSVIRWDGEEVPTLYVDSLELEATLTAEELGGEGEHLVTVWTPTPGGGETAPDTVTVFEGGDDIETEGPDDPSGDDF